MINEYSMLMLMFSSYTSNNEYSNKVIHDQGVLDVNVQFLP